MYRRVNPVICPYFEAQRLQRRSYGARGRTFPRKEGSESVAAIKCVLRSLGFNRMASFNIL